MKFHNWPSAKSGDLQRHEAISKLFVDHQHLLNGIFDKDYPRLSAEPAHLLRHYQCLSSGEYVLMKIAVDIWCRSGGARVTELLDTLDVHNFCNVLGALSFVRGQEIERMRCFKF